MHVQTPHMIEEKVEDEAVTQNVTVPMESWKTFMKAFSYSDNKDTDLSEAYNMMVSSASVYDGATVIPFNTFRVVAMFDDILGFFEQVKVSELESIGLNLLNVVDSIDMMYDIVALLDDTDDFSYYLNGSAGSGSYDEDSLDHLDDITLYYDSSTYDD